MAKNNWNRPALRRQGRDIENINGDVPAGVFVPRRPRVSKEQSRAEIERAYADYVAKGGTIQKIPPDRRK